MRRNVLVLEDQVEAQKAITQMLRNVSDELTVFCTDNLKEAYTIALENTIDVFILDIIIRPKTAGDVSGFLFAEKLRMIEKYSFSPIIFVTALQDLELNAYKRIRSYDYIEKPFSQAEVEKTFRKALRFETPRETDKSIYFRADGILHAYRTDEIVYAEVYKHTLTIYGTRKKTDISYMTCGQFLKKVDSNDFIQCSRNTIINRNFVDNIDFTNRLIKMEGYKQAVLIGITYVKKMKKEFEK